MTILRKASILCAIALALGTVEICAAQASQPCTSYFGNEDAQILNSPQIADRVVLRNVLNDIATSGYAPDMKEKMAACAYARYRAAFQGLAQTPAAPKIIAPSVNETPVPMVPATAPSVAPMKNYAPEQLLQNGQTLMDMGQQMVQMGNMIDQAQAVASQQARNKAAKVIAYDELMSARADDSPTTALQLDESAEAFVQTCSVLVHPGPSERRPVFRAIACGMYVEGLTQGLLKYPGAVKLLHLKKVSTAICVEPAESSPHNLLAVILNFIETHPEMKDDRTGDVATLALLLNYHCKLR